MVAKLLGFQNLLHVQHVRIAAQRGQKFGFPVGHQPAATLQYRPLSGQGLQASPIAAGRANRTAPLHHGVADFSGSGGLAIEHLSVDDHLTGNAVGDKKVGKGVRGHRTANQIGVDHSGPDVIFHHHLHPQQLPQLPGQIVVVPSPLEGGIHPSGAAVNQPGQTDANAQQMVRADPGNSQKVGNLPVEHLQRPAVFIQLIFRVPPEEDGSLQVGEHQVDPVGAHIHPTDGVSRGHKLQHHPGPPGGLALLRGSGVGFLQKPAADKPGHRTGDGRCGKPQLLCHFHPGNGAVLIDVFFYQVVIIPPEQKVIASLFGHYDPPRLIC